MLTEVTSIDKAGFQRIHFTVRIILGFASRRYFRGIVVNNPPTREIAVDLPKKSFSPKMVKMIYFGSDCRRL